MHPTDRSLRFQRLLVALQDQFDELLDEISTLQEPLNENKVGHLIDRQQKVDPQTENENQHRSDREMAMPRGASSDLRISVRSSQGVEARDSLRSDGGFNMLMGQKDKIKEQLRVSMKNIYEEHDVYRSDGIAAAICKSRGFRFITLAMIILSSVWTAVDVDLEGLEEPEKGLKNAMQALFCAFFLGEVILRFVAWETKRAAFHDLWYLFDVFLSLLLVLEAVVMPSIEATQLESHGVKRLYYTRTVSRVCLCFQVCRIFKLVRMLPEAKTTMTCVFIGLRSVSATGLLVIAFVYGFAILARICSEGTHVGEEYFATFVDCVYTLLIMGVVPENQHFLRDIDDAPWYFICLLFIFMVFVQLTIMNLLIGLLCKVVENVADAEKEANEGIFLRKTMAAAIAEVDADSDGLISKSEVDSILKNRKAIESLQRVGIDVIALVDGIDVMYEVAGVNEFEVDDFVEALQQFRASTVATVNVITELRKCLYKRVDLLEKKVLSSFNGRCVGQRTNTRKMTFSNSVKAATSEPSTPRSSSPTHIVSPRIRSHGDIDADSASPSGPNTRTYAM